MQIAREIDRDLTIDEAALLADRSPSWVRGKRMYGPLIPTEKNGRHAVDAASLFALLARIRSKRKQKRPHLRLVVDNTKT